MGQVIAREETSVSGQTGAPHEIWYRYGGRELGYTGNNGTSDMAMSASISERQKVTPTNQGTFRNKQLAGTAYADFAQAYDPLNSYNQGSSSGSYTVQMGDTLQSIAQGLYGDSGLWYKIAEVNGLSAYSGLIEGQRLTLPTGVMNATHNASSFKAYDPSSTLGDVNPSTNPTPQKKSNKCGAFGTILLAVIAIAVAVALPQLVPALAPTALGGGVAGAAISGAIGAAAGSIVSQGVGVATGIQNKFSFKGVALAAIGGAVGSGFGKFNILGEAAGGSASGIANAVVRGALSSAIKQGIGTVTGLQDKFSWAGVAAAGIGAGVGNVIGGDLPELSGSGRSLSNIAAHTGVGAASLIANAATRSAIEGSNFGRNIEAGLPDVIGQTLGRALGSRLSEGPAQRARSDEPHYIAALAEGSKPLVLTPISIDPVTVNVPLVGQAAEAAVGASWSGGFETVQSTGGVGDSVKGSDGTMLFLAPDGFTNLPSDAAVLEALNSQNGSVLPSIDWEKVRLGAKIGGALMALVSADELGRAYSTPIYGMNADISFRSGLTDVWITSNGEKIGAISSRTDLEHVKFVDTLDGAPGYFKDGYVNAFIVRTIPETGLQVGFGISIGSRREAEIYNDGVASHKSASEIDNEIASERANSGYVQGKFSAREMRYAPGTVFSTGTHPSSSSDWLSIDGAAPIPNSVAQRLIGQKVNNFDKLRSSLWQAVAKDYKLKQDFNASNLALMERGNAPYAPERAQVGGRVTFEIHHPNEIASGGSVYDLGNMRIVTPKTHLEIHNGKR